MALEAQTHDITATLITFAKPIPEQTFTRLLLQPDCLERYAELGPTIRRLSLSLGEQTFAPEQTGLPVQMNVGFRGRATVGFVQLGDTQPQFFTPEFNEAYLKDSDGNVVGIFQPDTQPQEIVPSSKRRSRIWMGSKHE